MGIPKNDLTGKKFGQLTVISYLGNSKWLCRCSCGKETEVRTSSLNNGKTKSCGCLRGQHTKNNTRQFKPKTDLTGKVFNYLTPVYYIKGGKWHCKCKCGNQCDVTSRNLITGHTKSCGCLRKESAAKNVIDMNGYQDQNIKVLERDGSSKGGIARWKCLCKHCGNIFTTQGANIRSGQTKSCGCVHSFNEQQIIKILTENNIEFSTQYTFPDLLGINNGHLRFDFAIFKDKKLSHLIEYNGLQHYEKPDGEWGKEYNVLIQNDKRKIEYCKKNNIELRIIKYDQKYTLKDLI